MTDQRPIDPSTLRDGDIVRAKRGEYGVVEGVFHSYPISSGWGIGSEAEEDGLFAWNDKGWTITAILRPVLVKGDRVEWVDVATTKQGIYVDFYGVRGLPGKRLSTVSHEGREILVATEDLTRLPSAPEPAPIEVGDWWKSATGIVGVVLGVDGDTLTWRRLDGSLPLAGRTHVMAESWTRLDGPPEPAVGKVYVLTSFVCENIAGHHYRMGISGCHPWSEFLRCFTRQELATLQIVHTLGVE